MDLAELDEQIVHLNQVFQDAKGPGWIRFDSYYDWSESGTEIGHMVIVVRIRKAWDDDFILEELADLYGFSVAFDTGDTELVGTHDDIAIILAQYLSILLNSFLIVCTMSHDEVVRVLEIIRSLIVVRIPG